jgi:hypothetical protein
VGVVNKKQRPSGEEVRRALLVLIDNWEEECADPIRARWEEECAAPKLS